MPRDVPPWILHFLPGRVSAATSPTQGRLAPNGRYRSCPFRTGRKPRTQHIAHPPAEGRLARNPLRLNDGRASTLGKVRRRARCRAGRPSPRSVACQNELEFRAWPMGDVDKPAAPARPLTSGHRIIPLMRVARSRGCRDRMPDLQRAAGLGGPCGTQEDLGFRSDSSHSSSLALDRGAAWSRRFQDEYRS